MILFRLYDVGRTWLLRLCSPLTGGPDILGIRAAMKQRGAKSLVVDTTAAEYADSSGLRWLMALQQSLATHGIVIRVLASRNSKVLRNLELLGGAFEVTTDARRAWYRKAWRKVRPHRAQREAVPA
jgi:MFS superfamily sulfate permease-like transporter